MYTLEPPMCIVKVMNKDVCVNIWEWKENGVIIKFCMQMDRICLIYLPDTNKVSCLLRREVDGWGFDMSGRQFNVPDKISGTITYLKN